MHKCNLVKHVNVHRRRELQYTFDFLGSESVNRVNPTLLLMLSYVQKESIMALPPTYPSDFSRHVRYFSISAGNLLCGKRNVVH